MLCASHIFAPSRGSVRDEGVASGRDEVLRLLEQGGSRISFCRSPRGSPSPFCRPHFPGSHWPDTPSHPHSLAFYYFPWKMGYKGLQGSRASPLSTPLRENLKSPLPHSPSSFKCNLCKALLIFAKYKKPITPRRLCSPFLRWSLLVATLRGIYLSKFDSV